MSVVRMGALIGRWVPVMAYMGLIFYESAQPALPTAVEHVWDKALHGAGYGGLAWLCVRALTDRFRAPTTPRTALVALVLAIGYGVTDEWHQSFVPPRQADANDLIADAVGAAIVVALCLAWSSWRARPAKSL